MYYGKSLRNALSCLLFIVPRHNYVAAFRSNFDYTKHLLYAYNFIEHLDFMFPNQQKFIENTNHNKAILQRDEEEENERTKKNIVKDFQ